jgi:predicted nucleic acid-binding protein
MTEVSFVDTNILVYARDPRQERKQHLAADLIQRLWQQRAGRTSAQVLSEYYSTITRKLNPRVEAEDAWDDVLAFMAWNAQPIDHEILIAAREIERRYGTSWWDASIVAAAQAQRCTTLLTEDFQDGMVFGQLKVRNPFVPRVQEPHAEYQVKLSPRPLHRARGRPAKATL